MLSSDNMSLPINIETIQVHPSVYTIKNNVCEKASFRKRMKQGLYFIRNIQDLFLGYLRAVGDVEDPFRVVRGTFYPV